MPEQPPAGGCRNVKIAVVGASGSGKTSLSRLLARRFDASRIELDALNWGPNWTPAPAHLLRERVAGALTGDCWVCDGNYQAVRDLVWGRADMLIWLDYPLRIVLCRLMRRTAGRWLSGEALWNGNRERLRTLFFSRDSLFVWELRSFRRRRRALPPLFQRPEYAHLQVVRHRSPSETRAWLERI